MSRALPHSSNVAELPSQPRSEIAAPLKDSRRHHIAASVTMVAELEQDLEEEKARNAKLLEHNTRLQTAWDGSKIEVEAAAGRVKHAEMRLREIEARCDEKVSAAQAERDEAVRKCTALETIFASTERMWAQWHAIKNESA